MFCAMITNTSQRVRCFLQLLLHKKSFLVSQESSKHSNIPDPKNGSFGDSCEIQRLQALRVLVLEKYVCIYIR